MDELDEELIDRDKKNDTSIDQTDRVREREIGRHREKKEERRKEKGGMKEGCKRQRERRTK